MQSRSAIALEDGRVDRPPSPVSGEGELAELAEESATFFVDFFLARSMTFSIMRSELDKQPVISGIV